MVRADEWANLSILIKLQLCKSVQIKCFEKLICPLFIVPVVYFPSMISPYKDFLVAIVCDQ